MALGIGLGAALADSMGAAGYAAGLGAVLLAFMALPRLQGEIESRR